MHEQHEQHEQYERRLRRSVAGGVVVLALLPGVVAGGVAELAGAGPAGSWAAAGFGAISGGAVGLVVIRVKGRG